ncbi:MAG: hypothetical protein BGO86_10435 [Chryseobacterium sp. 36-9]|nr:MAG: hypothetical protein BGO86_10435 [Chryseobacterium sp. 36-9]
MKKLSLFFLITASLFQSCTSKDKHPNVLTLEKLIENGEVVFVEKKDSVSLQPFITFVNDSVYVVQTQEQVSADTKNIKSNEKAVKDVVIKNSITIKNVISGKTYLSETVDSKYPIRINKKNDVIIDDAMFLAPDYTTKVKADTTFAKNITDIKVDEKLKKLKEFDKSITTKLTNTGRLGTMHKLFYYQRGERKFKSTSECYLIIENGNYLYNNRLGILKNQIK